MTEERRDVLKMLADKVITVDEAERLLKALAAGDERRQQAQERPGHGSWRKSFAVGDIASAVAGIGPAVRGVVQEAVAGLGIDVSEDEDEEEGLQPVVLADGAFTVAPGSKLIVRCTRQGGTAGPCDVALVGAKGDRCIVKADPGRKVRVLAGPSRAVILSGGSGLEVVVPAAVEKVRVVTPGGAIHVTDLLSELRAKTMGGAIEGTGLCRPFVVRTLGGPIRLGLAATLEGEGTADTSGGWIELAVPRSLHARLRASTLGGAINVEEGLGSVSTLGGVARKRVEVVMGEGTSQATVNLKTLGGDIRVCAERPQAAAGGLPPAT